MRRNTPNILRQNQRKPQYFNVVREKRQYLMKDNQIADF